MKIFCFQRCEQHNWFTILTKWPKLTSTVITDWNRANLYNCGSLVTLFFLFSLSWNYIEVSNCVLLWHYLTFTFGMKCHFHTKSPLFLNSLFRKINVIQLTLMRPSIHISINKVTDIEWLSLGMSVYLNVQSYTSAIFNIATECVKALNFKSYRKMWDPGMYAHTIQCRNITLELTMVISS